jgi:carboxyl-terminal processing protease
MSKTLRALSKILATGAVVVIVLTAAFVGGVASALFLTHAAEPLPTSPPVPTPTVPADVSRADYEAFELFWEVWALLDANYYGELPSMEDAGYAAAHGMLATFDDEYTALIEPEVAEIMAEDSSGTFEGIGAYVELDEQGTVVVSGVFEGGPAEAAGVQPGDTVLRVDSVPLAGKTLYEAIALIRGPSGSEVTLLVSRGAVPEPFEVVVRRARLEIPLVEWEMLEGSIGYVSLFEFGAPARERLEAALEELLRQEPRGLVFDLRGNPGGWLDQAIRVADLFLGDGVIVTERWNDGREVSEEATAGDLAETVPLVVLVNGGSASASEIVAGALQGNGRAILVGTQTYGKGSVQSTYDLDDGSELRVTSARWFTPDGRAISADGLSPDVAVPWPEDGDPDYDPQLDRAVEYLLEGYWWPA